MFEGGKPPFKGDSEAIRLPGQGAGALLRVPHGQGGLRSAIGPVRPSGEVSDQRELSSTLYLEIFTPLNSVCPNLSFPHAVSGNPLPILSRFRPKDCRNDKNRGISRQKLFSGLGSNLPGSQE